MDSESVNMFTTRGTLDYTLLTPEAANDVSVAAIVLSIFWGSVSKGCRSKTGLIVEPDFK